MSNQIKVTEYSSDGVSSYYVAGIAVGSQWEQNLMNQLGGTKTQRGSIKFTTDPRNAMVGMNIAFDYYDKREKNSSQGNAGAAPQNNQSQQPSGSNAAPLENKVWAHGATICVRASFLKDNEQLKQNFKQQFGATWDRDNKVWVIQNQNNAFTVPQIETFLGLSPAAGAQVQSGNSMVSEVVFLTPQELDKFSLAINCLQRGGSIKVSA